MTKKLEEEFNLPPIEEVTQQETLPTVEESKESIEEVQGALSVSEKINLAFKEIKGLEDHEVEMNDIAKKAIESYEQLMNLGMNVSDMAAGKVFAEASNMLKIALDASDAKTKAKLQQIDLMLKKARIDKFSDKGTNEETVQATVFDRNDLLKIIKGGGGDS
jgi:hypothetical protein